MKQALGYINVCSISEPYGLTRTDGKRLDRLILLPLKVGKQFVWDVLAPSGIDNGCVANPGTAAKELKTAKYVCLTDKGHIFQPLASEIQGGVGPSMSTFLMKTSVKYSCTTRKIEPGFTGRGSLAIQAGKAAIVVETVWDEDHLSELYYL